MTDGRDIVDINPDAERVMVELEADLAIAAANYRRALEEAERQAPGERYVLVAEELRREWESGQRVQGAAAEGQSRLTDARKAQIERDASTGPKV